MSETVKKMRLNQHQRAAKEKAERALRRKCDRLAVRIVSIVDKHGLFNMPAYGGIEAAREVRELLIKRFG